MGHEFGAKIAPQIASSVLLSALKEKFRSLQWPIIRDEGNTFSVAFANRQSYSWDQDFVIKVDEELYLLDHMSPRSAQKVMSVVDEVLAGLDRSAIWEEL